MYRGRVLNDLWTEQRVTLQFQGCQADISGIRASGFAHAILRPSVWVACRRSLTTVYQS
jgi:hypothetical protein